MLLVLIIACEISFWVFLLLGLAARYLLACAGSAQCCWCVYPSSISFCSSLRFSTCAAASLPTKRMAWPQPTLGSLWPSALA